MGRIAVVGAMREELAALARDLDEPRSMSFGSREFRLGTLAGRPVVLALSGIGKVAAAATAALLIDRYEVEALLFTGVAGGLGAGVHVGDVVIADALLQHDLDASPLFPRFEVPLSGRSRFDTDALWSRALASAAAGTGHRVHRGLVVSGDRFVATGAESAALRALLPDALAVEMEGAAVAQVCHDFARPFAIARTISDRADGTAHVDFARFVAEVAAECSHRIVMGALTMR